jgi:predicted CXXCH cytochrome family protein
MSMHGKAAANHAVERAECQECHTAEDALVKFGLNKVYAEKGEYAGSLTKNLPITCTVCHDPHDAHYAGQLRKSISEADLTKNLCMKCHYKRGVPDPTTYRGPHSPEGPLVVGDGGWWSPTMEALYPTGRVEATHGSAAANPELCAGCHMNRFDYKDSAGATINGTGHTFEAIPCLSATGAPVPNGTCTETQRTYKSCTGAGCHGSEGVARSAITTAQLRIANLVADLDRTLQKVHADWKTCRSKNPPAAGSCGNNTGTFNGKNTFNTPDGIYTTAEGAAFNYDLGTRVTAVIHNPLLVEALLITSIQQVKKDYGVSTQSVVDLTPQLKQH